MSVDGTFRGQFHAFAIEYFNKVFSGEWTSTGAAATIEAAISEAISAERGANVTCSNCGFPRGQHDPPDHPFGRCPTRTRASGDWTAKDGRANSSEEFVRLTKRVAEIIQDSAHTLINGSVATVAGVIMAQLAHAEGLAPTKPYSAADFEADRVRCATIVETMPLWDSRERETRKEAIAAIMGGK